MSTIYVAKTKMLISWAVDFAYAKMRFSHDAAHTILTVRQCMTSYKAFTTAGLAR